MVRSVSIAVIILLAVVGACQAQQEEPPSVGLAREAAQMAQSLSMSARDQAEFMRDDAEGKKTEALGVRLEADTAGATPSELSPGDYDVVIGDAFKTGGLVSYVAGAQHDIEAEVHVGNAEGEAMMSNWSGAISQFNFGVDDFGLANDDYVTATDTGYYNAYAQYDEALDGWSLVLMNLIL